MRHHRRSSRGAADLHFPLPGCPILAKAKIGYREDWLTRPERGRTAPPHLVYGGRNLATSRKKSARDERTTKKRTAAAAKQGKTTRRRGASSRASNKSGGTTRKRASSDRKASGSSGTAKAAKQKSSAKKKTTAKKKTAPQRKTAASKPNAQRRAAQGRGSRSDQVGSTRENGTAKRRAGKPIVGGAAAEHPVKPSKSAGRARPGDAGAAGGHRRTTDRQASGPAGGALTSSLDPPQAPAEKRNFGLRGAAPWVARHAAKHAAELRRRNAEPPPPGSARATLRVPEEADQIKADVARLHQITSKIRQLCRRLDRNFYEVGQLLADIQHQDLHLAKGYSSFESFLDRETELGRANALRLIRIAHTFFRESAYDYGIDRLTAALAALDGDVAPGSPSQPSSSSFSSPALPTKPPIRFNE